MEAVQLVDAPDGSALPTYDELIMERQLGSGGRAEVYRATARGPDEDVHVVAVKLPLRDGDDLSQGLDGIHRVRHPCVRPVLGRATLGTRGCLILEYVDGWNLYRFMELLGRKGQGLPPSVVTHVLMEVCKGLSYLHKELKGPLHDLKPDNIMISRRGNVCLIDYIEQYGQQATHEQERQELEDLDIADMVTHVNTWFGTARYMAPEQIIGSGTSSVLVDIYAVGIILHKILTGRSVIPSNRLMPVLMSLAVQGPTEDQRARVMEEHPDLGRIFNICTAMDPRERFQSAEELLKALDDLNRASLEDLNDLLDEIGPDVRASEADE